MKKPLFQKDLFPHWVTINIRFRDLDPLNHVNNAIFSTYYEEARFAFIRDVPHLEKELRRGFGFVLANVQIDFIKSVEFPSTLLIGSGIKKLGNTSITSYQAIYHETSKELISVAESTGVWLDLENQKPAKIPEIENIEKFKIGYDRL